MLLSLLVAGFAALAQGVPTQTVAAAGRDGEARRVTTAPDSLRALRSARRAQESFEFVRKQYLPREPGVVYHQCDLHIGRWCIWNDDSNNRVPPPESPHITQARAKLLATLDSVGQRFPGDEWVAAQEVRYLIEAKRYADAAKIADRCSASGSLYRCHAFAAVAYHDSGAVAAADSAFDVALAAMPDSVRCKWTDISVLLDDDIGDRYDHADCAGRGRIAAGFWRLTTPLYLRNHDFRSEFLARVTHTEMQRDAQATMGSNDDAFRETGLRYGYDTWFVRDDPPPGSMGETPIAGYREGGSGFNFVPDWSVFRSPANLRANDWDLKERTARTLYGPAYARHFASVTPQIALFRRGDSALVVATYDLHGDTLLNRSGLEAGLFAVPVDSTALGEPIGTVETNARSRGALMTKAPWGPQIVSLELLDPAKKAAARARIGLRPRAGSGRIDMSDLLMFAVPSPDSLPAGLEDALTHTIYGEEVDRNTLLGLFWETYGVRAEGESFAIAITLERIQDGFMRRAAERLHLATPFSPVKLQWTEVPSRTNGIVSRSVTIDLSRLEPGRYEITLQVTPPDAPPIASKREITLRR
ncbi:MAG TPA: hypothetical protein VJN70_20095 [Gemmatimonadaceae bacterium]|nr:hypothetical protein [Gemmatimonadaceae bacterium]